MTLIINNFYIYCIKKIHKSIKAVEKKNESMCFPFKRRLV